METRNATRALWVFLVLAILGSNQTWASTYTYIVVDSNGNEVIRGNSTSSGTPNAPDNIKSPWCDLTYWDAATGGNTIATLPGSDANVYVRYTTKAAYTDYFNGTMRFKLKVNDVYRYASPDNQKIWNSPTEGSSSEYSYFTLSGDPYHTKIYSEGKGVGAGPLAYVSTVGNQLTFSTSEVSTTYNEFIVVAGGSSQNALRFLKTPDETYLNQGNPLVAWQTNDRVNSGNRVTFEAVLTQVSVTYHVINAATGNEGVTVTANQDEGSTPVLPFQTNQTPLSCTINTGTFYTNAARTIDNNGAAISESNKEFWVTYTFDAATLKANTNIEFSTDFASAKWMTMQFKNHPNLYVQYNNNLTEKNLKRDSTTPDDDSYSFAFIGDPFKFRIVNKAAGNSKDIQDGGPNPNSNHLRYLDLKTGSDNRQWTLLNSNQGTQYFRIMLASTFNASTKYYLNDANPVQMFDTSDMAAHIFATSVASMPTVAFTQASYATSKNTPVTITANATLNGGSAITHIEIQQNDGNGNYTTVAQADNASTVSYTLDASAYGNYYFRATAISDGHAELTATTSDVTVTVIYPTVTGGPFTLSLIDKSGNTLKSWNLNHTDVENAFGDPLPRDWRSPLATAYTYYSTLVDARTNSGSNTVDWTASPPATVYVGYSLITSASDPNYIDLNPEVTDIAERVKRSDDDATKVRNAAQFGQLYMLRFLNGVDDYLENGNDEVEITARKPVYPYANGDGAMYIYDGDRWEAQRGEGASTRTRWPWYILSPSQDPYHVYVTSWQQSHTQTDTDTNYYNFLRTYYNTSINQVVTTTISDDPKVTNTSLPGGDATAVPTQYMLLGSKGAYKLVTTAEVNGSHQTVNSFENYWKNNPTVQTLAGEDPAANNSTLTAKGWHRYGAWANSANWGSNSKTKTYHYDNHWYKTFDMGDGTFDLVPTEIDAVLVLLDNHGWEIMRHNIVKYVEDDYAAVKDMLRKYDSPMVKQYKFYATKNVTHKVAGYHKYNVANGTKDALTENDRVDGDRVFTSLAQYPQKFSGGALQDLYVIYDVKDNYASSYKPAATTEGTASKFLMIQGNKYAHATNATTVVGENTLPATVTDDYYWFVKPNFEMDTEMGYLYDVDEDGLKPEEAVIIDRDATNTLYYNQGRAGLDPYNLRIQNAGTNTYLTTNATKAVLDGSEWSGGDGSGTALSLTNATATFDAGSFDDRTCKVTNATFMAVQDANGNMRLMPRFDHEHVVQAFTTLSTPAATQSAGDTSNGQSTRFTMPVTYKIVDDNGTIVFSETVADNVGLILPRRLQSPFVERYTFHSTLALARDATKRGIESDVTSANMHETLTDQTVYVGYSAYSSFGDYPVVLYTPGANGRYIHPVYQTGTTKSVEEWWQLKNMHKNFSSDDIHTITPENYPFLDNTFAWSIRGNTPDPYNALPYNKGTQMYVKHYGGDNGTNRRTDYMTKNPDDPNVDRYSLLYFNDDITNNNITLYNRRSGKFVVYNDEGRLEASKTPAERNTAQQIVMVHLPEIVINVMHGDAQSPFGIAAKLQGYYKSGCTWNWDNSTAPFYLDRAFVSNHQFHYAMPESASDMSHRITGPVNDALVLDTDSIFVTFDLAPNWGTLSTTANVDEDGYTTDVKPSHNSNTLYWYNIRGEHDNDYNFKANSTLVPAEVKKGGKYIYNSESEKDSQEGKLSQWVFLGSPYNLKIAERYHGMSSWLGISKNATNGTKAYVYNVQPDDVVTTWELLKNITGDTPKLYLRPQRALNGEAPLVYLSKEGTEVSASTFLKAIDVKFVTESSAHTVTFKLYDRDGNYMALPENGGIADFPLIGVADGDDLTSTFIHTTMVRRFCEYKFYSDPEFSTEITHASDAISTIYVKWDYTDDAPVFSKGNEPRDYQYYMIGVGNAPNYYLMDVVVGEGNHHSFVPTASAVSPRDYAHQFAVVGNPYAFKLYNRSDGTFIRRTEDLNLTFDLTETIEGVEKPTTEMEFDLPVDNATVYSSTETHFRSKFSGRFLAANSNNFYMSGTAHNKTRFRYIIVPLHVFWEEQTEWTDENNNQQKDYRMYGLEMNPEGTARTTAERFNSNNLRASDNKIGIAFDFNHAFCNYTFYLHYDWSSQMSDPIPEEGLSYYGGKDQTKRQFFATYSVDWEEFGKLHLIGLPHDDYPGDADHILKFTGKGNQTADEGHTFLMTYISEGENKTALNRARDDTSGAYRFEFQGDPYDLQITCIGTGDNYEEIVLGTQRTTNGNEAFSQENGNLMMLSDNTSYTTLSHFEIIKRSNGNHVLYLLDETNGRFYSSLHPSSKNMSELIAYTINPTGNMSVKDMQRRIVELLVVPAIPQYRVTWNVVDDNHNIVATESIPYIEEGTVLTFDDMPASLKRHYCDYNNMYSDQNCTTEYTGNTVTVTAQMNIYVPYTLNSGAPDFSLDIPSMEDADNNYWYEMAFPHADAFVYSHNSDGAGTYIIKYDAFHDINTIRENGGDAPWENFRWALIGTPYGVQFFNREAEKYLTLDGNNLTMSNNGTVFDLMDDWQGELCAVYDEATGLYLSKKPNNIVSSSSANNQSTSVEFSNENGLATLFLRLHYSGNTERLEGVGGSSMRGTIENIVIKSFQKKGKKLTEVLPTRWKRAFCNYTFHWDVTATDDNYNENAETVTTITQEMVNKSKQASDNTVYIHVTYTVESPFEWSTASTDYTGKHWYYLVNNHIQGNERGKMVFRTNEATLRVSQGLVDNHLYLNNYEYCVIGDPYGFKLLNRYDPDKKFNEYISVAKETGTEGEPGYDNGRDNHDEGYRLEQAENNGQCIFEMMPGMHSYNFWIHPAYDGDDHLFAEYENGNYSFVGNNYNGSNAIASDSKHTMKYLKANGASNFRLEIQSDATLAEYVKYAGFVGGLKYDLVTEDMLTAATNNNLTAEDKAEIRELVDNPDNIVQMEQGYYRIVPWAWEGNDAGRHYLRGYHDIREKTAASGYNRNLKTETLAQAEYDPASIFWFENTTETGTGYQRYFVKTQGLSLNGNGLNDINAETDYKVRYEDLGASITQLKVASVGGERAHDYLSCTTTSQTSTDQCFDEQVGVYKTRFYLQKVGDDENQLPLKLKMNNNGDGFCYASYYVPFDIDITTVGSVAFIGKYEHVNDKAGEPIEGTSYIEAEYKLVCHSVNDATGLTQRFVPAGTPVLVRTPDEDTHTEEDGTTRYVDINLPYLSPSEAVSPESNHFMGSYLTCKLDLEENTIVYVFGKSNTYGVGFFKNSGNVEGMTKHNWNVNHNKMYYLNHSATAKQFSLMFYEADETTGVLQLVSGCDTSHGDQNAIYDLQGRKVSSDSNAKLPSGIYIMNGKKIIVK